jgi:ABC-type phosphate transport system permease subunit
MTMLTHIGGPLKTARYPSGRRSATATGTANAHMPMIKRFVMGTLTVLVLGGTLAAIIGLKAAIYLSRLNY